MTLPAGRIITREEWDRSVPSLDQLAKGSVDALVYHYSGRDAERRINHALCIETVRSIDSYHSGQGWNGVGYNWLACHHGYCFEGRGWGGYPAATLGHNSHTQAICFLGGDTARDDVTVEGRRALAHLAQEFFSWRGKETRVGGHREFVATSCPGDEIMAWIAAEGWKASDPKEKPWPIPVPAWFWKWALWQRQRFNYPTRAKWMHARPSGAPKRVPDWAWVRLAAMTPKT